ncbi:hypothetical protein JCM6882_002179 [Rhodosporidiobolus microsporus]
MLSRLAARPPCSRCFNSPAFPSLRPHPILKHQLHPTSPAGGLQRAGAGAWSAGAALGGARGLSGGPGAARDRSVRRTRAASLQPEWGTERAGAAGAQRWASTERDTEPPRPVYAHEDLLLPSSTSSGRFSSTHGRLRRSGSPSSSSSSSRSGKTQPFFSPSYLLAEEPPLPPPSTSPLVPLSTPIPAALPPSVLSNGLPNPSIRWRARPQTSIGDDVDTYKALSKFRLSTLVVLTTMAGYAMCPVDPTVTHAAMDAFAQSLAGLPPLTDAASAAAASSTSTGGNFLSSSLSSASNSLTLSVLLPTTVGTTLCAFSAASFNQLIEAPYDAQMARTRNRPLPKRSVTPLHAATYGALTGSVGLATLYAINPLSAFLGAFTIALYCPLYTITKRHTPYNTWIGSVVGAIPPLIGWAACTDSVDPLTQPGAWALFGLMFAWQFPHFLSLAHTLRSSYASSGYRMLAVLDPPHNALVSLRYSLALVPLCAAFPWLGLTHWAFAPLSLLPNGLLAVTAWRFWRKREERRAKELFWASLIQLPVVLALAMATKAGLWETKEDVPAEQGQQQKEEEQPVRAV